MSAGRKSGLAVATGITSGSLMWSVSAALGLGVLMLAHAWVFEIIRYFGAAYLMYLAYKSAKSALSSKELAAKGMSGSLKTLYTKGLALHLTNPKAVLFFGSLYAIGIPPTASPSDLITVILAVGLLSFTVFHGYALIFSTPLMTRLYMRLRRWFEAAFAVGFGVASFKILTSRLQ